MLLLSKFIDDNAVMQTSIIFSPINKHGSCNIPLTLKHSKDNYVGCSKGWLISASDGIIVLSNPFQSFNNVIHLLSLPTDNIVLRVVLSDSPTLTSNYLVFVMYISRNDNDNMCSRFAYVRSGEKSWSSVYVGLDMDDAIYYNDRLYALLFENEGLVCCDITSSTHELVMSVPNVSVPENWDNKRDLICMQLLESRGELLCVATKYKLKQNKLISRILRFISTYRSDKAGRSVYIPIGFQIFKFEREENVWKEQKSLEGGQAIFVRQTSSAIVDVSGFPNCMPNHIYFDHSGFDDMKVGVFNLEDASFEFVDCRQKGCPIWVQATIDMSEPGDVHH